MGSLVNEEISFPLRNDGSPRTRHCEPAQDESLFTEELKAGAAISLWIPCVEIASGGLEIM
jgi:hypothetical protein